MRSCHGIFSGKFAGAWRMQQAGRVCADKMRVRLKLLRRDALERPDPHQVQAECARNFFVVVRKFSRLPLDNARVSSLKNFLHASRCVTQISTDAVENFWITRA